MQRRILNDLRPNFIAGVRMIICEGSGPLGLLPSRGDSRLRRLLERFDEKETWNLGEIESVSIQGDSCRTQSSITHSVMDEEDVDTEGTQ